jgi:hypothetical protein
VLFAGCIPAAGITDDRAGRSESSASQVFFMPWLTLTQNQAGLGFGFWDWPPQAANLMRYFMISSVSLIWVTPDPETHIVSAYNKMRYAPPVRDVFGILSDIVRHNHLDALEAAVACIEITAARQVLAPIVSNKTLYVRNNVQRHATKPAFAMLSCEGLAAEARSEWIDRQLAAHRTAAENHQWAVDNGLSQEIAGGLLPACTLTTVTATAHIRHWIGFLHEKTTPPGIADAIRELFSYELPVLSQIMQW